MEWVNSSTQIPGISSSDEGASSFFATPFPKLGKQTLDCPPPPDSVMRRQNSLVRRSQPRTLPKLYGSVAEGFTVMIGCFLKFVYPTGPGILSMLLLVTPRKLNHVYGCFKCFMDVSVALHFSILELDAEFVSN